MPDVLTPLDVATRLRVSVGALVRATRTVDTLAPIPMAVMGLLDRARPMTTAELANLRQVRHQTMAATVKELVDGGYVDTLPDDRDGRKKLLRLTQDGLQALETDRQRRVAMLAGALESTLSAGQLALLSRALHVIDRVTAAIES